MEEVRTFGTMTRDLLEMSDWLDSEGVTHVAMESTGVLWKPVWNILEGLFKLLLVNPREVKQVPGRKSDVRDCQWIAHLLQCGLLRTSFVPPRPWRTARLDTPVGSRNCCPSRAAANRIHKTLRTPTPGERGGIGCPASRAGTCCTPWWRRTRSRQLAEFCEKLWQDPN
jgi:hypothetical protein